MRCFLLISILLFSYYLNAQEGCTDPQANNFDPQALENDGSCLYDQTTIIPELIAADLPNALNEQSGMIFFNGQFWMINDGGTGAEMLVWDENTQALIDTIQFLNIGNIDWESLEQDQDFVYIGDFGNNMGNRTDLRILRLAKSDLLGDNPESAIPEIIEFSYPEQTDFSDQFNNHNFDCEAFIVWQNQCYLFTKEWVSNLTSIYRVPIQVGVHEAELLGILQVQGLVSGASFDPESNVIMLLGYQLDTAILPFTFMMWDYPSNNFSLGNKRRFHLDWSNYQAETIAPVGNDCWYLGSEYWEIGPLGFQNQLRKINVTPYLSGSIGLQEQNIFKNDFLFPNPSSGTIHLPEGVQVIKVLNLEGKEVEIHTEGRRLILETGMYIVELRQFENTYQQVIIVVD